MTEPRSTPSHQVCPTFADLWCESACGGLANPALCRARAEIAAWRALGTQEQTGRLSVARPRLDPALRDAVNSCPFRGSVLPLPLQEDCDCRGQELSECRAGRGKTPGRVTLRDCLACRSEPR